MASELCEVCRPGLLSVYQIRRRHRRRPRLSTDVVFFVVAACTLYQCLYVYVCVLAKSNEPLAVGNKGLDMPHATCHRPQYAYNMSARISL